MPTLIIDNGNGVHAIKTNGSPAEVVEVPIPNDDSGDVLQFLERMIA
jgi:hypothetical protein